MAVLEHFGVESELYSRTLEQTRSSATQSKKIEEANLKISLDEHRRMIPTAKEGEEPFVELDRESALKHIGVVEMKKATIMTGVYI